MSVDDETLMAFADGELEEARMATVAQAVAADPALRAKLERLQAVRARVAALADVAPAPRPGLMEAARQAAAARRAGSSRTTGIAMAASIAGLAVAVGLTMESRLRPSTASGVLAAALERTPSGQVLDRDEVMVAPIYTVVAADGRSCRTYRMLGEAGATEGAACRTGDRWRILAVAKIPIPPGKSVFSQASGEEPAAVAAAVDALKPGDPLAATAEAALIARGWE